MQLRVSLLVVIAACGGESESEEPLFPENYAYSEVRDCRTSTDHNLTMVRVLADSTAIDAYMLRDRPFPEGSIILKEERPFGDDTCVTDIQGWTVMKKLAEGSSPGTLDWAWQRVDPLRGVITEDENQCASCHATCDPPDGYLGTCAPP